MPLSHLTSYTAQEWNNLGITSFGAAPHVSKVDHPDTNVTIDPAGWVGTHLFAFRMITLANHDAKIEVDNHSTEQMNVNVTPGKAPEDFMTYWTVETEPNNGKGDQWSVTFEVQKDKKDTGKWVFTKGKDDPDDKKDRKGCLGVFALMLH